MALDGKSYPAHTISESMSTDFAMQNLIQSLFADKNLLLEQIKGMAKEIATLKEQNLILHNAHLQRDSEFVSDKSNAYFASQGSHSHRRNSAHVERSSCVKEGRTNPDIVSDKFGAVPTAPGFWRRSTFGKIDSANKSIKAAADASNFGKHPSKTFNTSSKPIRKPCKFCGTTHIWGDRKKNCPAFLTTCSICFKKNHSVNVCWFKTDKPLKSNSMPNFRTNRSDKKPDISNRCNSDIESRDIINNEVTDMNGTSPSEIEPECNLEITSNDDSCKSVVLEEIDHRDPSEVLGKIEEMDHSDPASSWKQFKERFQLIHKANKWNLESNPVQIAKLLVAAGAKTQDVFRKLNLDEHKVSYDVVIKAFDQVFLPKDENTEYDKSVSYPKKDKLVIAKEAIIKDTEMADDEFSKLSKEEKEEWLNQNSAIYYSELFYKRACEYKKQCESREDTQSHKADPQSGKSLTLKENEFGSWKYVSDEKDDDAKSCRSGKKKKSKRKARK